MRDPFWVSRGGSCEKRDRWRSGRRSPRMLRLANRNKADTRAHYVIRLLADPGRQLAEPHEEASCTFLLRRKLGSVYLPPLSAGDSSVGIGLICACSGSDIFDLESLVLEVPLAVDMLARSRSQPPSLQRTM